MAAHMDIHWMWIEYFRTVLECHPSGFTFEQMQDQDWHGAKVEIQSARDPRSVGIEGIVFANTSLEISILDEKNKK